MTLSLKNPSPQVIHGGHLLYKVLTLLLPWLKKCFIKHETSRILFVLFKHVALFLLLYTRTQCISFPIYIYISKNNTQK